MWSLWRTFSPPSVQIIFDGQMAARLSLLGLHHTSILINDIKNFFLFNKKPRTLRYFSLGNGD